MLLCLCVYVCVAGYTRLNRPLCHLGATLPCKGSTSVVVHSVDSGSSAKASNLFQAEGCSGLINVGIARQVWALRNFAVFCHVLRALPQHHAKLPDALAGKCLQVFFLRQLLPGRWTSHTHDLITVEFQVQVEHSIRHSVLECWTLDVGCWTHVGRFCSSLFAFEFVYFEEV